MYELMKGAFFSSSDKITLRWERITASNNLSIQPIIIYFSVSPSSQVGIGKFIQAGWRILERETTSSQHKSLKMVMMRSRTFLFWLLSLISFLIASLHQFFHLSSMPAKTLLRNFRFHFTQRDFLFHIKRKI